MSIYINSKRQYFEFLGFAAHTETNEELAVFYRIDVDTEPGTKAMPRAEFEAQVEWADGSVQPSYRPTTDADKIRIYSCSLKCPRRRQLDSRA